MLTLEGSDEFVGADHVQCGHSEDLLGVVDAGLLVDLGGDGDGRVDGVGDDGDHRVGADLSGGPGEGGHDGGVGVEEVVPGHAGLPGHAGGDDDDLRAGQGGLHLVGAHEAGDPGLGLDVGEVGGDPGGGHDVVQGQLGHGGVQLEQHREGLADTWNRRVRLCQNNKANFL